VDRIDLASLCGQSVPNRCCRLDGRARVAQIHCKNRPGYPRKVSIVSDFVIKDSPHYTAQNMEGWLLKSTSGQVIRSFRFDDSFRDIIWLAMWIWRDICVAAMAQGIMTDNQVLSVLHEIRTTVNSTFYSDLLEIRALPAPDEVLSCTLHFSPSY